MYTIVSNDISGCEYYNMSDEFKTRYDDLLSLINADTEQIPTAEKREIFAKLMIQMKENSFESLHNGATIIEYDENVTHPVKEIEDYGGQNIRFEPGPSQVIGVEAINYISTYNPLDGVNSYNYDADTDTYNNNIDYGNNEGIIAEWQIKGSRQAAKELVSELPREEQKVFEQYLSFSSASLKDIKEMLPLTPEQRENYLQLTVNTTVPEKKRAIYAQTLSKEEIDILRKSPLRTRDEHTWEVLTNNKLALDFIDMNNYRDAVWDNPRLIQFIDKIPVKKSLDGELSDREYHTKKEKEILKLALNSAKHRNVDISDLISEENKTLLHPEPVKIGKIEEYDR